jgi:Asp/Glu/hydantoin racemase
MMERAKQYGLDVEKIEFDFGYPIGMVGSKVPFPAQIRGNQNHPGSYHFPISKKLIEEWSAPDEKKKEWVGWNVPEYIRAAKELEEEGVKALVVSCGLAGTMQEELASSVDIPVMSTSLLLVPMVSRMLKKGKKVGIMTHSLQRCLAENKLFKNVGIDQSILIEIVGMMESEHSEVWRTQFGPRGGYDPKKVEEAIVAVAKNFVTENPDIGAIVLECTEMPLYAAAIQSATGLPVFDGNGLVNLLYSSIKKERYF